MPKSSEQGVTMSTALAMVTARYTRSDELHPRCPLSLQVLHHGSKTSTFHFCHILPKCFEDTLDILLSNNANNIFPSVELIHKNMELYRNIPHMSVKFERRFNDQFDEYVLVFSPELPLFNALRVFIGAIDAQPRRVLLATGSRPFLDLHYRAFQEHHKSCVPAMSRFDELVSQQLFSQIILHSPTVKENKKQVKSRKKSSSGFQVAIRDDNCNSFPQMGVSPEASKRLVDTIFQMSSTFFENWKVVECMMPAWIICHHSRGRTFEIGFRPECDPFIDAEEFKRGFHDDPAHEIWLVSEASLLEYGIPDKVKQILKMPIVGDLPAAKQLTKCRKSSAGLPHNPERRKVSKKNITNNEDHEEVATAVHSTDEYLGMSIEVYWSKGCGGGSWQKGSIIAQDGDEVQVEYNNSTIHTHDVAKIKYKICPQTHANQSRKSVVWECTGCGCHNKTDSTPAPRSACADCRREYGLFGVVVGGKRRRTEITSVQRKMDLKQLCQDGPADIFCSPSVQTHGTTDQRGESPTDTASMHVDSRYINNRSCTPLSDASDGASQGACNTPLDGCL